MVKKEKRTNNYILQCQGFDKTPHSEIKISDTFNSTEIKISVSQTLTSSRLRIEVFSVE